MTTELYCLAVLSFFFLYAWLPSSVAKYRAYGVGWLAGNREDPGKPLSQWGERALRAHANLKDYFPPFISSILILHMMQISNNTTQTAAVIFVGARLVHFVVYSMGRPWLRAIIWAVAMISQTILFIQIFKQSGLVFL